MTNIDEQLKILYIQLDHITSNNKDDENYEDQINYIEKQIHDLKNQENLFCKDSSTGKKIYQYNGPVYRFDNYIGNSGLIKTSAKSNDKAKSNIIYKLKEKMKLSRNTNLTIDEQRIKEVN